MKSIYFLIKSITKLYETYLKDKKKYKDQDVVAKLATKVKVGGAGAWGSIPMPPHAQMSDADITNLVKWMLTGS
jgi:cytochrome c